MTGTAASDQPSRMTDGTTFHHFIAGEWCDSTSGVTFESRNPAETRDVVGRFQQGTRADVAMAVKAAETAGPMWRRTPAPKRGEILFRAARLHFDTALGCLKAGQPQPPDWVISEAWYRLGEMMERCGDPIADVAAVMQRAGWLPATSSARTEAAPREATTASHQQRSHQPPSAAAGVACRLPAPIERAPSRGSVAIPLSPVPLDPVTPRLPEPTSRRC